jgi:hypothetical protein
VPLVLLFVLVVPTLFLRQRAQCEHVDASFIWTTVFVPRRKVKITFTGSGICGPEMVSGPLSMSQG